MPNIKIINNDNNLTFGIPYSNWTSSPKFKSKNRIVDENGNRIASDYKGHQYKIIEKRERAFSREERIQRVFLGILTIICTLSLGLFSKQVRNLLTKTNENVRFAVLVPPSLTNPIPLGQSSSTPSKKSEAPPPQQKPPENEITIFPETLAKIQTCMKEILNNEEPNGVKFYTSQTTHRVFIIESDPGLIFKMNASSYSQAPMRDRYEKMKKAETVLKTHELGLLTIPRAKIFKLTADGQEHEIIAEEKLDITPEESIQEQYFEEHAEQLTAAIDQLALFICKTGYDDVEWRNNPVLNNSLDANGNLKLALIDIENTGKPETGLFGGELKRRGLVGLVTEEQGNRVKEVAEKNKISTLRFESAHQARKKVLEETRELKKYYEQKKISQGDELIVVDLNSLGLELTKTVTRTIGKTKETITLETVAQAVINEINRSIKTATSQVPLKHRRLISLDSNEEPLAPYRNLGAKQSQNTKERLDNLWIAEIIRALVKEGHIFKLDTNRWDGFVYYVQT